MKDTKLGCLIYGPLDHHLDHLAPLAWALDAPLIVTEGEVAAQAETFYPFVETLYWDYTCVHDNLVQNFDAIVCSLPRALFDEAFLFAQMSHNKTISTIWCPHGNSDKGHTAPFMEALSEERVALVYGNKMVDFLKEKGVYNKIETIIPMGNLRLEQYRAKAAHFDSLVNEYILCHLPANQPTILYAPTWEDRESNSSYPFALRVLLDVVPTHVNLIVKLHPNTLRTRELEVDRLIHQCSAHHNICFLKEFPTIYPLLAAVDAYIGDMSSIGYDMLAFENPMFFLTRQGSYHDLLPCGTPLFLEDLPNVFQKIEAVLDTPSPHNKNKNRIYNYTFDKSASINKLKTSITNSLEKKRALY